jgi:hypothetical protein
MVNVGGTTGIPSSRPIMGGRFLFSNLRHCEEEQSDDEAIPNLSGDCFGRKYIALATLAPGASAGVTEEVNGGTNVR